jgi:hypothetical protein
MTPDLTTALAALTTIAQFDVAAVTVKKGRGEYVPVGHCAYLREVARKALGLPLLDSGKS